MKPTHDEINARIKAWWASKPTYVTLPDALGWTRDEMNAWFRNSQQVPDRPLPVWPMAGPGAEHRSLVVSSGTNDEMNAIFDRMDKGIDELRADLAAFKATLQEGQEGLDASSKRLAAMADLIATTSKGA